MSLHKGTFGSLAKAAFSRVGRKSTFRVKKIHFSKNFVAHNSVKYLPMDNERILSPEATDEDEMNWGLRPRRIDEYIGQRATIERLSIAIAAAKGRGEKLDHLLLHGPPGLGKTTLAYILAEEMHREIALTSGPALERPADLMGFLLNANEGDIIFIDEIHRL
ncbi:MAG: AAA family ATPase, partial [Abditibacteriaceae bacterium]